MTEWTLPWAPASATGLGPMPGTDPFEAARIVAGELPDLVHLPELPERGAGAEMIGRTAALLVDLHVDVHAGRWRLVNRPGGDERHARELLERDLDAFEDAAGNHPGPVKVQLLGPWTLAASLELPRGDKVLADEGAVADLAASLTEAVALHVAGIRRRLPKAERVLVQLGEPLLPAVLAGHVPTASGWAAHPIPEPAPAEQVLASVLRAAGGDGGVWCDAPAPPIGVLRRAGATFVAFDASHLESIPEEDLGEAIEEGAGLLLGLVPPPPATSADVDVIAAVARRLWGRLGLGEGHWDSVVVTPETDLDGLSSDHVRQVLRRCRDVGRALREPEGDGDWRGDEDRRDERDERDHDRRGDDRRAIDRRGDD